MDEKSSRGTTIVLVVLTILAAPIGVFLGLMYTLGMHSPTEALVLAFVLPAIVIVLATARSIRHRNVLASSVITIMLCAVMAIGIFIAFSPLAYALY
jgi:hypothetical protein